MCGGEKGKKEGPESSGCEVNDVLIASLSPLRKKGEEREMKQPKQRRRKGIKLKEEKF
jgi:hypothetical protein